jgi:glycerol-3-phosphate dehydrogenase (NAD(P)+)
MEHTITIIGGGEIGNAMSTLLSPSPDNTVHVWDVDRSKRSSDLDLKDMLAEATVVFYCVPSAHLREAVKKSAPYLPQTATVLSLTKGLEPKSSATMDEVLKESLPARQAFTLLHGPMLAEELCQGMSGFAICATRSPKTFKTIAKLFTPTPLHLTHSTDISGIALMGVLKNIYAIGYGIINELDWCSNEKGWYLTQALQEMQLALPVFSGRKATALTLAGLGDLYATAQSKYSSNHAFGAYLVSKKGKKPVAEGATALPSLLKRIKAKKAFILLKALDKVIRQQYRAKSVFDNLKEK